MWFLDVKCRSVVAIFCLIIVFHLCILMSLTGEMIGVKSTSVNEDDTNKVAQLLVHDEQHSDIINEEDSSTILNEQESEDFLDMADNIKQQSLHRDNLDLKIVTTARKILQAGEDKNNNNNNNNKDLEIVKALNPRDPKLCREGHIQGFDPVCGYMNCLRKLGKADNPHHKDLQPRSDSIDARARRKIHFIPGELDGIHIAFITQITDMQWSFGLYGSVADLGPKEGKFTSVLAHNVNTTFGERLFVSDLFNQDLMTGAEAGQYDTFLENLEDATGFTREVPDNKRKVYVQQRSAAHINTQEIWAWDLPQFRLVNIHIQRDSLSALRSLEKAACILRDGGMLIVDGADTSSSLSVHAVRQFFNVHGVSSLKPFLASRNKLYLTTPNWRDRFTDYFATNKNVLSLFTLEEISTDFYGPQFSYLVVDT